MNYDKELIKRRFESNFAKYDKLAKVQLEICQELSDLIVQSCVDPQRALEIGAGTGFLTSKLIERYPKAEWIINDLVAKSQDFVEPILGGINHCYLWGDAEFMELEHGVDLIASASTVQWFDDMPRFIQRATGMLNSGGVLALSTFGVQNFMEINETMGEALEYCSLDEWMSMFEVCSFDIKYSGEYTKRLCFDSPIDVLRHIKATGVNSIRHKQMTKGELERFDCEYRKLFSTGDQVSLTYHPMMIVARK